MKKYNLVLFITFLVIFFSAGELKAQKTESPILKITGEVDHAIQFSLPELQKMDRVALDRNDRDGKVHHYSGVLLSNLLNKAGASMGEALRGENLRKYAMVKAYDGYQVIFTLTELDPEFSDEKIILADQMDGKPLPPADGPFRIIVEKDKKPARCIKQVLSIEVGIAQ